MGRMDIYEAVPAGWPPAGSLPELDVRAKERMFLACRLTATKSPKSISKFFREKKLGHEWDTSTFRIKI